MGSNWGMQRLNHVGLAVVIDVEVAIAGNYMAYITLDKVDDGS